MDFLNKGKVQVAGSDMLIDLSDVERFKEIIDATPGENVDVLIQSPGGSAEATESIVELLRSRFGNIRFLVPGVAKSAATMLTMAGDSILIDESSELGPTDPQMIINGRQSPAGAIREQFKRAEKDLKTTPALMPAWLPILQQYGPSLLVECENHIALSQELVSKWLEAYMFRDDPKRRTKAGRIARHLADDRKFRSHARRIGLQELKRLQVDVVDTRSDPKLHQAVRELYVAILVTFEGTGAYKIFENSEGAALIKMVQLQAINLPASANP